MNFTVIRSLRIRNYIVVRMYIKVHVETVDTKDQSSAIVYCVCYVVCQQCRHTQRKLLGWLLKKVMGRNELEILMPSVNSVDIYSICKLMVWVKSSKSQLSKTFFGLKIH